MKALHARYPFLRAAREAVEAADADLAAVVSRGGDPVVERARGRIEAAIESSTVGEPHPSTRVELLSYPVARVIVSLVDEPALTARYARAEAATALERFGGDQGDLAELRSVSRERLSVGALLEEFDLTAAVSLRGDEALIDVGPYLRLASGLDDEDFRLVTRSLADGRVSVTGEELRLLLREAIRERVADGLPLSVPDEIDATLSGAVATIHERLSTIEITRDFDAVVPESFPPCIDHLLSRVADDDTLDAHSRHALVSFLAAIGMPREEIANRLAAAPDVSEGMARYQVAHLASDGGPTAYAPPSCLSMQAYGDCVNMDALCERIDHPLEYYEARLDGADPETDAGRSAAAYSSRAESQ